MHMICFAIPPTNTNPPTSTLLGYACDHCVELTSDSFRATRVEADVGYIEYKIIVQHRESWQIIGPVLQSKADLSSFCLEATKKLDMKYESPPMPVNLSTSGPLDMNLFQGDGDNLLQQRDGGGDNVQSVSAEDLQEVANLFEIRKKKRR